jgi:putative PIN family toxin of toxin-antitoxin system
VTPDLHFVFDTNAIVSALLFKSSVPGQAFATAMERGKILFSQATFLELNDVLRRKKFDRYLTLDEREEVLVSLLRDAIVSETDEEITSCRDKKDNKFLEIAVAGSARCLVTGDQDLLALHPFRAISILTPAAFLQSVTEPSK